MIKALALFVLMIFSNVSAAILDDIIIKSTNEAHQFVVTIQIKKNGHFKIASRKYTNTDGTEISIAQEQKTGRGKVRICGKKIRSSYQITCSGAATRFVITHSSRDNKLKITSYSYDPETKLDKTIKKKFAGNLFKIVIDYESLSIFNVDEKTTEPLYSFETPRRANTKKRPRLPSQDEFCCDVFSDDDEDEKMFKDFYSQLEDVPPMPLEDIKDKHGDPFFTKQELDILYSLVGRREEWLSNTDKKC
ncbi:hypothetical protein HOD08_01550 [bacterium]|jgi:hypothetical protein|nr:hypothetical protein [bacterium]